MMKIVMNKIKAFKALCESMSAIVSQTRMKVDPQKGFNMETMDGSHICLIAAKYAKEDLDDFQCDQSYELGLNFEDLVKIGKRLDVAKDSITLTYDPSGPKELKINVTREASKKSREFVIGLVDIETEEINLQSLESMEFDVKATFSNHNFYEAVKDAEIYSEVIVIKSNHNGLTLGAEGTMGRTSQNYNQDELKDFHYEASTEGTFAIQFLKSILESGNINGSKEGKSESSDSDFTLYLKSESPIKWVVKILDHSELLYFLAPRVEEDENITYEDDNIKVVTPKTIKNVQWIDESKVKEVFGKAEEIEAIEGVIAHLANQKEELVMRKEAAKKEDNFDLALQMVNEINAVVKQINTHQAKQSELEKTILA